MALNYFDMFAGLKMGVDILTETLPEDVPHTQKSGYVPTYTVRDEAGVVVFTGHDVVRLVDQAHLDRRSLTLFEDRYPVFTVF